MKIVQNNSYWRELLDFTPQLLMVFKIDDNEKTELVFVNKNSEIFLGHKPEELLLKSVNDGFIKKMLDSLVDKVAQHSREEIKDDAQKIEFLNKSGQPIELNFVYDGYRIKSSQNYHITVLLSLHQFKSVSELKFKPETEKQMITESMVMKALIERIPSIIETQHAIVIQGEPKTGKSTLVHYMLMLPQLSNWSICSEISEIDVIQEKNDEKPLLLVLENIQTIDNANQKKLLQLFEKYKSEKKEFKIIGTTTVALDKLLDSGKFLPELYYQLVAYTLHLPPLRFRKEDVDFYLNTKIENLKKVLDKKELVFSDESQVFIKSNQWENNFASLQEFVSSILPYIDGELIELPEEYRTGDGDQSNLFNDSKEGIISYDTMVRRYLEEVLQRTAGKIYGRSGAAQLLGLKPTTLQSKLKKLGIKR